MTNRGNDMKSKFSSIATAIRLGGAGAMVVAGTLVLSGGSAMAAPPGASTAYTCSGGALNLANPPASTFAEIPSGTYTNVTVTGICDVAPNAVINVLGDFNVAAGGVFDAQGAPSTITVRHDFTGGSGSIFALGCLPNPVGHTTGHPCGTSLVGNTISNVDPATASSNVTINGNIVATNSNVVLLYGVTIKHNVVLTGGGGPVPIPWAIKDNSIGHDLVVSNMTPNWLGVLRNNIGHDAILTNVTITDGAFGDPNPTIFVASNTVRHNLVCTGLGPAVAGGFPGEVNTVGHKALGQCANLPDVIPGG